MIEWGKYKPFFQKEEFECKCGCGTMNIRPELLDRLMQARRLAGFPFIITSGSRCESHNQAVGGHRNSAHLTGHAADISCRDMGTRGQIVKLLSDSYALFRIGIHPRFVHVDVDFDRPIGIYLY